MNGATFRVQVLRPPWLQNSDAPLIVISGGQTGVDRAALDVAREMGVPHGGWCPKGRLAEDGRISDEYQLWETDSPDYAVRTEWNVRDSHGTLVLTRGDLTGGTRLTVILALRYGRPVLVVDLAAVRDPALIAERILCWVRLHGIRVLNVAGPRESSCPGIYHQARNLLAVFVEKLARKVTEAAGLASLRASG